MGVGADLPTDPDDAGPPSLGGKRESLAGTLAGARVPVVFTLRGDEVVTAVDHKLKRSSVLRRLRRLHRLPGGLPSLESLAATGYLPLPE